jgi:methionyl aminopeptidase
MSTDDAAPAAANLVCKGCARELGQDGESLLQCPTCRECGFAPSYFCSQDCFTQSWGAHKAVHDVTCIVSVPPQVAATYRFRGGLRPGLLSPKRVVPKAIPRPDYALNRMGASASEEKAYRADKIVQLSTPQLEALRRLCRQGREIIEIAMAFVRPGITTDDIDRVVHAATIERGLYPSTLNYRRYPKSLCTSINEVICHGIPDSTVLQEGDIVNLDISAFGEGLHTDLNETVFVGRPSAETVELVHGAYESMLAGISVVRQGNLYKHIGDACARRADLDDLGLVRSVCGHGVGVQFHCPPDIPHYAGNKTTGQMRPGHAFTIEPMVNAGGRWQDVQWPDGWTMTTADGRRSAQFEHTMVVTPDPKAPVEILTSLTAPALGEPFYVRQLRAWDMPLPGSRLGEAGITLPDYLGYTVPPAVIEEPTPEVTAGADSAPIAAEATA